LERRHDTKLFNRVGRTIELTEPGRASLAEARAVLARVAAAELMMAELGGLQRGRLSLCASQTIAGYWLPRHLANYRRAYLGIELWLTVGNTAQVAAAVHEGAVEVGFVEGAVADPVLPSEIVARDQLVLVVAPDHPWARRALAELAELADIEWVLREPPSGCPNMPPNSTTSKWSGTTSRRITSRIKRSPTPPHSTKPSMPPSKASTRSAWSFRWTSPESLLSLRVVLELPSNEAVRAAVEAGAGATVISASVVAPSLEAGLLHRVRLDLPDRGFVALRHRERHCSRAATALLDAVRNAAGRASQ